MIPETKPLLWAALCGVALSMCFLVAAACTSCSTTATAETRARSALNTFALVADPAWEAVHEACIYRQRAINAEAQAGRMAVPEARRQLGAVRARCHALTDVFEAIHQAHDQAADLVESGHVADAEVWLVKLRERWRDAQELTQEGREPVAPDAGAPLVVVPGFGDEPHPVVTPLDGGAP